MDDWIDEKESFELLRRLFPNGAGGEDVMRALCPGGWCNSPLRLAIHPTPEQRWEEHCRIHENLNRLPWRKGPPEPPPDRETFFRELENSPTRMPEPDEVELAHLVGLCLWDILSDNHDLVFPDGRIRHMGSFRMVGGILYDFIDGRKPESTEEPDPLDVSNWDFSSWDMGYMDYYMGTIWVSGRTDLAPVYRLIFERLKILGLRWRYSFPRIGMVHFNKPESDTTNGAGYDPSEAFAREQEKEKEQAEVRRLQDELDEAYRESLEEAISRPPPSTVSAYRDVFSQWPLGWPPWRV